MDDFSDFLLFRLTGLGSSKSLDFTSTLPSGVVALISFTWNSENGLLVNHFSLNISDALKKEKD